MIRIKWPQIVLVLLAFFTAHVVQAKPWKGAELITRETYKYGAFEARIRAARGSGMVTAFFLWKDGSEIPGAQWQEQDFEIFGKNGRYQTQVMTPGNPRTEHATIHPLYTPGWENYYTYRMEWTPDYLAFYVDGHLVRRETNRTTYAKLLDPARAEPAQLRMSLWAGDWEWSGDFDATLAPAHTYVEFIQTYNYTPGSGTNGSDFTPRWRDEFDGTSINTNRWWFANWTFEYAVNDYVTRNAAVRNGKLVLALTDEATSGQFPSTAPADNPPLPPADDVVEEPTGPQPQPEDYSPVVLPARIEAENFSGYEDSTVGNEGDAGCYSGDFYVDTEITSDTSGICHIAYATAGEWVEYKVIAPEAGIYNLTLRTSTARSNIRLHVEANGEDVSGPLAVPRNGWQSFADLPVQLQLAEGEHTVRIVFDTGFANLNYLDFAQVDTGPVDPEEPVEIVTLPARIEAEDFTKYYDSTPGNQGSASCDTGDVDSQTTTDTSGTCNLAWITAGEWVEYEVLAPEAGNYVMTFRTATNRSGTMSFYVEIDGVDVSGSLVVPRRGWQTFSDISFPVELTTGEHSVRVVFETGDVNFNYLTIEEAGVVTPPPDPGTTVTIPSRIEAEAFTAFYDTTPGNLGAAACNSGDVDTEIAGDTDGGCNVAFTAPGEWTEYKIQTTGGSFNLIVRAATERASRTFRVLIDNTDVSGLLVAPMIGWQIYGDVVVSVTLTPGTHTVRLLHETGNVNVNYIEFKTRSAVDPEPEPEPEP
ncbi:MAG TPA: carbohydrate-binding protein, partial [Cellvibrio sp.]|nr:carbohydrate-binding protein [Cellvibrio sp.]